MILNSEDRELLELAAKAAGILVDFTNDGQIVWNVTDDQGHYSLWNPLRSDGDALRLAMSLSLSIIHSLSGEVMVMNHDASISKQESRDIFESATRRAIVRVAAEIGKNHSY